MTRIYHIVQFKDGSAYLLFNGCNWNCSFCVRKMGRWDFCLPDELKRELDNLWDMGEVKFLSIEEVVAILNENGVNLAFLGGGEPTIDRELKSLVERLKEEDIYVWLLTNGELLDEELVSAVKGVTFSIKALDNTLHRKITGVSNLRTLENFRRFACSGKIVAETVYAENLVECDEILKIAKYIALANPNIRFRIDPLVQNPVYSKVDKCIEKIKKILPYTYRIKANRGGIQKLLYPRLQFR